MRWLEPLTVTHGRQGRGDADLPPGTMSALVDPGRRSRSCPAHVAARRAHGKDVVLKLGRPGRVVGIVRTASGQPLADVPVELWVQGSGTLPSDLLDSLGNRRITPDEIVRLDPQPLKTGPQGAFQTPPTLLSGSTYRVSIRHDGFVPFVSDWVTLDGERAAIPAIRLQPLQKLTGQIQDRQGRAVAGARVFLAGRRSRNGDRCRRAICPGRHQPRKDRHPGRADGIPAPGLVGRSASARTEVGSLTLVRASEAPGPVMKPLADPIPPEESRALADRLLEPYLHDAMENGDDEPRLAAISALSEFDLDRALELFQNGEVPR